jgi:DnaK suppressor protein
MNTAHFKDTLLTELKTVDAEIEENKSQPSTEDASATERDEIADKIEDLEESQGENKVLIARRNALAIALDKIDEGTYGVCEIGGEPIEEERLEADPAARTCMAHMSH